MPKLTLYYPTKARVSDSGLIQIARPLKRLVAEAASTEESPLTEEHVDFVPVPYDAEVAQFSQDVAIEIETLGFSFRKTKMTEEAITALKPQIAKILNPVGLYVYLDKPLVWLKFQDPDGCHV